MGWVPPWGRPRAGGVRPHSLWWARQGSGICEGDGTARANAWPSKWFWPGPMRHPAGWPDVDCTRPSDRARWRASWRGSRRAGRGRRPCGRWLGVRRRSARSRRARIGTGAGPGTVSRRGFWPLGAPRGALVRHPVTGVPGRVSRVASGHGARAVARHRPIDALRSHQTSGDELARPPHEPPCSGALLYEDPLPVVRLGPRLS